jgi:hypothetical protein
VGWLLLLLAKAAHLAIAARKMATVVHRKTTAAMVAGLAGDLAPRLQHLSSNRMCRRMAIAAPGEERHVLAPLSETAPGKCTNTLLKTCRTDLSLVNMVTAGPTATTVAKVAIHYMGNVLFRSNLQPRLRLQRLLLPPLFPFHQLRLLQLCQYRTTVGAAVFTMLPRRA